MRKIVRKLYFDPRYISVISVLHRKCAFTWPLRVWLHFSESESGCRSELGIILLSECWVYPPNYTFWLLLLLRFYPIDQVRSTRKCYLVKDWHCWLYHSVIKPESFDIPKILVVIIWPNLGERKSYQTWGVGYCAKVACGQGSFCSGFSECWDHGRVLDWWWKELRHWKPQIGNPFLALLVQLDPWCIT